jgi:uncharacterized protein
VRQAHTLGTLRCALLALVLVAAMPWPAAAFDDQALARQSYENIILPGYERFDAAARTFADSAKALCDAPSAAALTATRVAAKDALLAWGRIEPLRFGPITEKQRTDRLLFYPDQHGIVGKQTAKLLAKHDPADIDADKLAGASVAVQGFGAVDVVLYGNGADALATSDPAAAFRCLYLHALAADIAQIAAETHAAWAGDYKHAWLQPGGDNKIYLSAKETTQALFRAYVTELEVIRFQRLAPVLGEAKPGAPAVPLLAHSGLGLAFLLANIEGSRALLGDHGFLAGDLAQTDKERGAVEILGSVATDLGFAMRAGDAALAMAPNPLADPQARQRLTPLSLALKNAEVTGRGALGELTGQTLGFNSLDGD